MRACAVGISMYRGVALGFTASLISRGAIMASGGGILQFKSALPVLFLYFAVTMLMVIYSALSAVRNFSFSEALSGKRRTALCACFAVISGAVFLLDIVKVWLI